MRYLTDNNEDSEHLGTITSDAICVSVRSSQVEPAPKLILLGAGLVGASALFFRKQRRTV